MQPMELKGKAELVPAYRLIRVFGDEQANRRHDAPLVGRAKELTFLTDMLARSMDERRCVMATVLGEAGVGKSRLVRELLASTGEDTLVLRGRCLPYGEAITFWPLLDIVRDAVEIAPRRAGRGSAACPGAHIGDREVARRVASMLGWSDEHLPVAELFWGIRELLERIARDRPIVLPDR